MDLEECVGVIALSTPEPPGEKGHCDESNMHHFRLLTLKTKPC